VEEEHGRRRVPLVAAVVAPVRVGMESEKLRGREREERAEESGRRIESRCMYLVLRILMRSGRSRR
jgi:hypothetical protein